MEACFRPVGPDARLVQWGGHAQPLDLAVRRYRVRYCATGMDQAKMPTRRWRGSLTPTCCSFGLTRLPARTRFCVKAVLRPPTGTGSHKGTGKQPPQRAAAGLSLWGQPAARCACPCRGAPRFEVQATGWQQWLLRRLRSRSMSSVAAGERREGRWAAGRFPSLGRP